MSVARKDDRHNGDLVDEIAKSFNRALGAERVEEDGASKPAKPRFVVTGDNRAVPPRNRRAR